MNNRGTSRNPIYAKKLLHEDARFAAGVFLNEKNNII